MNVFGEFKRWTVCGIALLSFAAGSLLTARLVRADSNRVFELRVYHVAPGKVEAVESLFREKSSKLLAKHDLKAVGYWMPDEGPMSENTFIYLLVHPSREEAKKNWDGLFADPEFQEMIKGVRAEGLVQKVDATYMHPTDFSPLK